MPESEGRSRTVRSMWARHNSQAALPQGHPVPQKNRFIPYDVRSTSLRSIRSTNSSNFGVPSPGRCYEEFQVWTVAVRRDVRADLVPVFVYWHTPHLLHELESPPGRTNRVSRIICPARPTTARPSRRPAPALASNPASSLAPGLAASRCFTLTGSVSSVERSSANSSWSICGPSSVATWRLLTPRYWHIASCARKQRGSTSTTYRATFNEMAVDAGNSSVTMPRTREVLVRTLLALEPSCIAPRGSVDSRKPRRGLRLSPVQLLRRVQVRQCITVQAHQCQRNARCQRPQDCFGSRATIRCAYKSARALNALCAGCQ